MRQVVDYCKEFYEQVLQHEKDAQQRWPLQGDRVRPFRTISNKAALVGAILDDTSRGRLKSINIQGGRDGVKEFVKILLRDTLFLATLSALEYELLNHLTSSGSSFVSVQRGFDAKASPRDVKFFELVKWMSADGLIDDKDLWEFVGAVRNDIVHYDAYARRSRSCPNIEHPIIMVEGQQIGGNLRSMIALTKAIEHDFFMVMCRLY